MCDDFSMLIFKGREVLGINDFATADIEAVRQSEPSKEAEAFNQELKTVCWREDEDL